MTSNEEEYDAGQCDQNVNDAEGKYEDARVELKSS